MEALGYIEQDSKPRAYKTNTMREAFSKCEKVLEKMRKVNNSHILFKPPSQNSKSLNEIMTDYLDLSMIEKNLKEGIYASSFQFISDVRKVFQKALRYIEPDHITGKVVSDMSLIFEAFVKEIEQLPVRELSGKPNSGGDK